MTQEGLRRDSGGAQGGLRRDSGGTQEGLRRNSGGTQEVQLKSKINNLCSCS